MNIGMMLAALFKALGVKLTPETVAEIETIVPTIPKRIQEFIVVTNGIIGVVNQMNARNARIEQKLDLLLEKMEVQCPPQTIHQTTPQ